MGLDLFDLVDRPRGRRIIDALRRAFPGMKWRYEYPSRWCNDAGWNVTGYSVLCGYDDDTFRTEYRRSDTGEVVSL